MKSTRRWHPVSADVPNALNLSNLDPDTFEHLGNCLAVSVLGSGVLSFAKGADSGRDGYFEGECDYPSKQERWSGVWYIQSKFCTRPGGNPSQKWLIEQVKRELKAFCDPNAQREWPDNWIFITNIDPSASKSGTIETIRKTIHSHNPRLSKRFHIWGPRTLSTKLANAPSVLTMFRHLMTPGAVVERLLKLLDQGESAMERVIRHLILNQFIEQQYTKLDQAGSSNDSRPGVHELFIDLPYALNNRDGALLLFRTIIKASAAHHTASHTMRTASCWHNWKKVPHRSRILFIRGGPGQGKSTATQYFAQINRAALMTASGNYFRSSVAKKIAQNIQTKASSDEFWPLEPRLPIIVDLKDYASWLSSRRQFEPKGVVTYLSTLWSTSCQVNVTSEHVRRVLSTHRCFVAFDGLDEVPSDVKDEVAAEVKKVMGDEWEAAGSDIFFICTSRPQGYSGQFDDIEGATLDLTYLDKGRAYECAVPILSMGRTEQEISVSKQTLSDALETEAVQQLMRTPLQCHIMAIVVRDGGRPPDRRWQLFSNFFHVIRRREARNKIGDKALLKLLQEETVLIKRLHDSLGFLLHARAESAAGSITSVSQSDFRTLAEKLASEASEGDAGNTVATLMRATTDRLVLVNTPISGEQLRFDVRQLQEFFAAEFLYEGQEAHTFLRRFEVIAGDSHWREVAHFAVSALVENQRRTELLLAVKALEALNQDLQHTDAHALAWTLAIGSIVAVRLLQEGVLEQEKSIRALFSHALEPLVYTQCDQLLYYATSVRGHNSRAWLIDYLIAKHAETPPQRRIGCVYCLTVLVGDDHPKLPLVLSLLKSESTATLTAVISKSIPWGARRRSIAHSWFMTFIIELIGDPDWHLRPTLTGAAVQYLQIDSQVLNREQSGRIPRHVWELLDEVFSPGVGERRIEIAGLVIGRSKFEPAGERRSKNDRASKRITTGLLKIWNDLLCYANSDSPAGIVAALESVTSKDAADVVAMPIRIRQCLPIGRGTRLMDGLLEIRASGVSPDWLAARDQRLDDQNSRITHLSWERKPTAAALRQVLISDPVAAIWTFLLPITPEEIDSKDPDLAPLLREIGDRILEEQLLVRDVGTLWTTLLRVRGNRADDQLRILFRGFFSTTDYEHTTWGRSLEPIELFLPNDIPLLYPIFHDLVHAMSGAARATGREPLIQFLKSLHVCFPDASSLIACHENSTYEPHIRASALLALASIRGGFAECSASLSELVVDALSGSHGEPFAHTLALWLCRFGNLRSKESQRICNIFAEQAMGRPGVQRAFETLAERWRELSTAPVSASNTQDIFGELISSRLPIIEAAAASPSGPHVPPGTAH
jgi:hypothetical protein